MEQDKLLTLQQAAEFLTIKIKTLYNWRSIGVLPKVKRYKQSFLAEFREKWIAGEIVV